MHSNVTGSSSQFAYRTSITMYSSPQKDPYNYSLNDELTRKSMIRKLPGQQNVNLGQHLEIVVLFQAAQIQRLNAMLSANRVRDKSVNKEHLDRHSFQMQIKQLSAIVDQSAKEKQKLQSRIKDLNNALQAKRASEGTNIDGALANKYQRALLQIGKMYDDNTKLQQQINQLNWQLQQNKTINKNQMQNNSFNHNNEYIQNDNRREKKLEQDLKKQVENTARMKNDYENQISGLNRQISQLQSRNSHTIAELREQFSKQMQNYKIRNQQSNSFTTQQMDDKIKRVEERLNKIRKQLEQSNTQKWALQAKIRQNQFKVHEYEGKIRNLERQVQQYKTKIKEGSLTYSVSPARNKNSLNSNQLSVNSSFNLNAQNVASSRSALTNQQLENNVALLSQQLQRLSSLLNQKNNEIQSLNQNTSNLKLNHEHELLTLRIKHESQLRLANQKNNYLHEQAQQFRRQCEKSKQKIQQIQMILQENTEKFRLQLLKVRQQERKVCQEIINKRVESLEMQWHRDRQQLNRLKDLNRQMSLQLDNMHFISAQQKSQRKLQQIKVLQKMQQQQKKYEEKLKMIQQDLRKQSQRQLNIKNNNLAQQLQKQQKKQQQNFQSQIQSQKQLRQNLQQQLQAAQQQNRRMWNQLNNLQLQYKELEGRIQRIQAQNSQKIREKEVEMMDRIKMINHQYENNIKIVQSQVEIKIQRQRQLKQEQLRAKNQNQQKDRVRILNLQQIVKQRDNQIRKLSQQIQWENRQQKQQSSREISKILSKLDQLMHQQSQTKLKIIEEMHQHNLPVMQSGNASLGLDSQLSQIKISLQHISSQVSSLGRQLVETTLTNSYTQSQMYIKQLQSQCSNYLNIINNKLDHSNSHNHQRNDTDSVLRNIWQQIQNNNRFNREEQEKWRTQFRKQEQILENLLQQRRKWENIKMQSQKIKHDCDKLQQIIQQNQKKYEEYRVRQQKFVSEINSKYLSQVQQCHEKISILQAQIQQRQNIIGQYSNKIMQASSMQSQELENLTKIIQVKSRQLLQLSNSVKQYKTKYENTKAKCLTIQKIMTTLIQESKNDMKMIEKIQQDNLALRRSMKKMEKQLYIQKQQKDRIVKQSEQQLRKISTQLTDQLHQYQQQFPSHQFYSQQSKLSSLQVQFSRLEQIINFLKKDNYVLQRQSYNQSTQQHIAKQFSYIKVRELNKEIERLIGENIELKDQIQRCRLQLVSQFHNQDANIENLSLIVVLMVEIQSLRSRFNTSQSNDEVARKSIHNSAENVRNIRLG